LRIQARALLKAAAGRHLRIMFPMVATTAEFEEAKRLVEGEVDYVRSHGNPLPSQLSLGVMVEVPSLLFEIEEIAAAADFLSIGSNDLMQFLFAADRGNKLVAGRFDAISPPSLRALRLVAQRAAMAGCPVTVCGEMAGRPLDAMALIGLGFRSLSMSPASIGPVKAMILALEARPLAELLEEELDSCSTGLRGRMSEFAERHGIPV
jgi:phosphotransferase system enzyme I (PtsP)